MARITPQAQQRALQNLTANFVPASAQQSQSLASVLSNFSPQQGSGGGVTYYTPIPGVEGPGIPRTGAPPSSRPSGSSTQPPSQPSLDGAQESFLSRQRALLSRYESLLGQEPSERGLSPEERQTFGQERESLQARYDSALEALKRQHEQEQQRLLGRYAAQGFSEPGAIEGPLASEPGIVTKALEESGETQAREAANLEQARAGDLLAVTRTEQDAERRARAEEADEFQRRQEAMIRMIEQQLELAQPERFSVGGGVTEYDPVTGTYRQAVEPQPEVASEIREIGGRQVVVTTTTDPRTGKVTVEQQDLGPAPEDDGGRSLSRTDVDVMGLPYSLIDYPVSRFREDIQSPVPPSWFLAWIQGMEPSREISPQKAQARWDKYRIQVQQPGEEDENLAPPPRRSSG